MLFHTYPTSGQQGKHNVFCREQTRRHKKGLDTCPLLTADLFDGHLAALHPLLCSASRIPVQLSPSGQMLTGVSLIPSQKLLQGYRQHNCGRNLLVLEQSCSCVQKDGCKSDGVRVFIGMLEQKRCLCISEATCAFMPTQEQRFLCACVTSACSSKLPLALCSWMLLNPSLTH